MSQTRLGILVNSSRVLPLDSVCILLRNFWAGISPCWPQSSLFWWRATRKATTEIEIYLVLETFCIKCMSASALLNLIIFFYCRSGQRVRMQKDCDEHLWTYTCEHNSQYDNNFFPNKSIMWIAWNKTFPWSPAPILSYSSLILLDSKVLLLARRARRNKLRFPINNTCTWK